jgi:hypothetical protein
MFVESCRRKRQLRQELNVRPDCFDTGKHFTPDGVKTHRRHYYKHSTTTWSQTVVATQTKVYATSRELLARPRRVAGRRRKTDDLIVGGILFS